MATQIKLRRDTAANWSSANPVLAQGEPGYDLTSKRLKIGDGVTAWNVLAWFDDQVTDLSAVAQSIVPSVDVTYDLGSPAKRFRDLYLSGNTIDLGGATISATADGNVSIPGLSETKFKPFAIIDGRTTPGQGYYNETAVPEDSVIIDQATWLWATVGPAGTFVPSVYSATYDPSNTGFITDIAILEANYYDSNQDYVVINTDYLYVLPAGTLLTRASISASEPLMAIPASVSSTSASVSVVGGGASTGDVTFSGVKVIGAGTASGDGLGYSTLELVPDSNLYNNHQYLIIDPTAPNHIHLRAGGTQDASTAELYLGGERNHVRIRDGIGVSLQNDVFTTNFYSFQQGVDYDTAVWSTDEFNNTWLDINITDPMNPTRPSTPFDVPFYNFTQFPQNRIEVFDGTNYTDLIGNGQAYTLGNQYQLRIGITQTPATNPTSITSLTFRVDTLRQNSLLLENNSFDLSVNQSAYVYADQIIQFTTGSGNLTIVTDDNNTSRTWAFGADGNLTVPGHILPDTTLAYDIGSPTQRFKDLYLSGNTIYLGESTITTTAGGGIATPVDRPLGSWGVAYPDTGGSAGTYTLDFARTPGSTIYIHGGWQNPNYGGPGVPGPGGTFDWVEGDGNFTVEGNTLVITTSEQYQIMNCWEVYTLSGDSIAATTLTGDTVATTTVSFPSGATFRIVAVPTTSKGASGDSAGDMAFDGTHVYYCTASYTDGVSDIWRRVAWSADTW